MSASERLNLAVNAGASVTGVAQPAIGGLYKVTVAGTIAGTNAIQIQDPHGDWTDSGITVADGSFDLYIPPGMVRANTGVGASGVYIYATRIPLAM